MVSPIARTPEQNQRIEYCAAGSPGAYANQRTTYQNVNSDSIIYTGSADQTPYVKPAPVKVFQFVATPPSTRMNARSDTTRIDHLPAYGFSFGEGTEWAMNSCWDRVRSRGRKIPRFRDKDISKGIEDWWDDPERRKGSDPCVNAFGSGVSLIFPGFDATLSFNSYTDYRNGHISESDFYLDQSLILSGAFVKPLGIYLTAVDVNSCISN